MNEILSFVATWMDLEGIMPSEISQTEKDKYCMIPVICEMWKKKTDKHSKTATVIENKYVVAREKGEERKEMGETD